MRLIWERSDAGRRITPTELADHLEISTASVTGMLQRLHDGGLVSFVRNPDDGRSKFVVPFDRGASSDEIDPLGARVRAHAATLTPSEAERIARFLDAVTDAVDVECA